MVTYIQQQPYFGQGGVPTTVQSDDALPNATIDRIIRRAFDSVVGGTPPDTALKDAVTKEGGNKGHYDAARLPLVYGFPVGGE